MPWLLPRFALTAATLALAAWAVGYWPARWAAGAEGVESLTGALGICLAAAVLAAAPMFVVARRGPAALSAAALAGVGLRLFVTLPLAAVYCWWQAPRWEVFAPALVAAYLVFLALDTWCAVRLIRRLPAGVAATGASA